MTINVEAYANADDVLIAWQPDAWSNDWVGFQLERRNNTTQQSTILSNRIPPKPSEKPVPDAGITSTQSPFRRCIWTDHSVIDTDNVSYRVTAMKAGLVRVSTRAFPSAATPRSSCAGAAPMPTRR